MSENLREGPVSSNMVGIICPIEIGLTDLPKSGGGLSTPPVLTALELKTRQDLETMSC